MNAEDTLYKSVDLDAAESAKLRGIQDSQIALQQFAAQVQAAGERRAVVIQEQGRDFWTAIAEKYKLDIEHVNYVPNEDFTKLVPKMIKL